jgi:hypothetical protein
VENLGFVIAGWGVILGGLTLYAVLLIRRLALARRASLDIRRQAASALGPDRPR